MASTATAYLHDLHAQARPGRTNSALPGIVATVANLGGLATGPLVAGAVAQWLPEPLATVQALFTAAMTLCLALVVCTPETVDRHLPSVAPPSRFALRPASRAVFCAAGALGAFAFAILGLISSLGAAMLHDRLHNDSHFIAGMAPFLMFGSAAAAQLVLGRMALSRILTLGALIFPVGLALCTVALGRPLLLLYLVAVSLSGAGAGLLFKGGIDQAAAAAASASRAGVLAVYFVISYIGMGLPAVLFSITLRHTGIETAMAGFAAVLSAGAVAAVAVALRGRPPSRSQQPSSLSGG
jgi:hypothetical protein